MGRWWGEVPMRALLLSVMLSGCATVAGSEASLKSPAAQCIQDDPARLCCGPRGSGAVQARYGDCPYAYSMQRPPAQNGWQYLERP